MSLADALAAQPTRVRGPKCSAGTAWHALSNADRETFAAALERGVEYSRLAPALASVAKTGKVSAGTLSRHVRKLCDCEGDQ